jgi:N-acyl homoserine lactone hydrolase
MNVFSITPLLVGLRSADQGMMTYQSDYGKRIWLPMWSFLLRSGSTNILVDTGLADFMAPPEFTSETGLTPLPMEDALDAAGLSPTDITIVVNTHLHDDHCGNNELFADVPAYVQSREVAFLRNPHPVDDRYDEDLLESCEIRPVDGDLEILPGLEVLLTPGHTPGCQTVKVQTPTGLVIIPGFCCNERNFPKSGAAVCPGVHGDAYQAYETAQRVRSLGGIILPLHGLSVPERLKHAKT